MFSFFGLQQKRRLRKAAFVRSPDFFTTGLRRSCLILANRRKKFGHFPQVIGQPCRHCRCNPQAGVNPNEIVKGKVQGDCGFQVLQLFAEPVRQPRKPSDSG
jgi:hypothetical protein